MSTRTRQIIAIVCAAAMAALATPQLSEHLRGFAPVIAVAIAAALHRMNAEKASDATADTEGEAKADKTAGDQ